MDLLRLLYITLIQIEDELWKKDEEYQELWYKMDDLEKELTSGMTRKQRALFGEYRKQREHLMMLELRRLLSRYTIVVQPRN